MNNVYFNKYIIASIPNIICQPNLDLEYLLEVTPWYFKLIFQSFYNISILSLLWLFFFWFILDFLMTQLITSFSVFQEPPEDCELGFEKPCIREHK